MVEVDGPVLTTRESGLPESEKKPMEEPLAQRIYNQGIKLGACGRSVVKGLV